jgi:hypothetical protein
LRRAPAAVQAQALELHWTGAKGALPPSQPPPRLRRLWRAGLPGHVLFPPTASWSCPGTSSTCGCGCPLRTFGVSAARVRRWRGRANGARLPEGIQVSRQQRWGLHWGGCVCTNGVHPPPPTHTLLSLTCLAGTLTAFRQQRAREGEGTGQDGTEGRYPSTHPPTCSANRASRSAFSLSARCCRRRFSTFSSSFSADKTSRKSANWDSV